MRTGFDPLQEKQNLRKIGPFYYGNISLTRYLLGFNQIDFYLLGNSPAFSCRNLVGLNFNWNDIDLLIAFCAAIKLKAL